MLSLSESVQPTTTMVKSGCIVYSVEKNYNDSGGLYDTWIMSKQILLTSPSGRGIRDDLLWWKLVADYDNFFPLLSVCGAPTVLMLICLIFKLSFLGIYFLILFIICVSILEPLDPLIVRITFWQNVFGKVWSYRNIISRTI